VGDRDGGRGRTAADAFAALRFSRLFAAVPMTATRGQIARVDALTMIGEILQTRPSVRCSVASMARVDEQLERFSSVNEPKMARARDERRHPPGEFHPIRDGQKT
jgi:hypothetical protein